MSKYDTPSRSWIYKYGFVTEIESEKAPKGLSEDVVRFISAKKNEPEWLLDWRLKAYRRWLTMTPPDWAKLDIEPIDYQGYYYYSAPKSMGDGPKSLDEVDPALIETYNKLGIPLHEQERLAGVAVDAVFDSISVATTFRAKLAEAGVIFMPISKAVSTRMVKRYLGSVVLARQLLCLPEFGSLWRRPGLCAQRAWPDGAFHLLSHQRAKHGPVRAHPDCLR